MSSASRQETTNRKPDRCNMQIEVNHPKTCQKNHAFYPNNLSLYFIIRRYCDHLVSFFFSSLTKALSSPILALTLSLKLNPYFFPFLICNK